MKISNHPCLLLLTTTTLALSGTQALPVSRDDTLSVLQARDSPDYVIVPMDNLNTGGYVTLGFGSAGSQNQLLVDTGSSDTWAYDAGCLSYGCPRYSYFDYSKSTTFNSTHSSNPFSITYLDGTLVSGFYAADEIKFGSVTVPNVPFAVATTTNTGDSSGFMGLGFPDYSATAIKGGPVYPTIPGVFKENNITQRTAFSYWINGETDAGGHIVFGGYDKTKINGDLFTLSLVEDGKYAVADNKPITYLVAFDGITLDGNAVTPAGTSYVALLDTGSTFSYFDQATRDSIAATLGATYSSAYSMDVVPCSAGNNLLFNFNFGSGQTITVKGSAFIFEGYGASTCMFGVGVIGASDTHISLGIPFFRSAYVVFDQDANEVQVGQAINDVTTTPSIVVLSKIATPVAETPVESTTAAADETETELEYCEA